VAAHVKSTLKKLRVRIHALSATTDRACQQPKPDPKIIIEIKSPRHASLVVASSIA
jgi:Uma2 family endonuclease